MHGNKCKFFLQKNNKKYYIFKKKILLLKFGDLKKFHQHCPEISGKVSF